LEPPAENCFVIPMVKRAKQRLSPTTSSVVKLPAPFCHPAKAVDHGEPKPHRCDQ